MKHCLARASCVRQAVILTGCLLMRSGDVGNVSIASCHIHSVESSDWLKRSGDVRTLQVSKLSQVTRLVYLDQATRFTKDLRELHGQQHSKVGEWIRYSNAALYYSLIRRHGIFYSRYHLRNDIVW